MSGLRPVPLLAAVLLAVVLGAAVGLVGQDDRTGPPTGGAEQGTDPASALPWVPEAALPPEARDTLARIDAGGPFPYDEDDRTFHNREGLLPDQEVGYYREYTVVTPGEDDRGPRRIVTGGEGEYYWTSDHYASFERIAR